MTLNNKLLLSIIAFSLAIIVIGVFGLYTDYSNLDGFIPFGEMLFLLAGTYLLAKNGTFISSDEYRFTRLGISIMLIGLLCKIKHWQLAQEILIFGCFSFVLIYLYHLIHNNRKNWRDYLKLVCIVAIATGLFFKLFHFPYLKEIKFFAAVILVILLTDLIKTKKIHLSNK